MKDAPAFDFYPERWLVGTAAMSDSEQLAYLRLLCHQWTMDGLPEDVAVLRRLAGKGVTDAVLAKFPSDSEGKRRNARLEVIRQEQRKRIVKSREKIEKMNAARASTRSSTRDTTSPLLSASSPLTTHPVLLEKEPKAPAVPKAQKDSDFLAACEQKLNPAMNPPPDLLTAWDEWQAYRQRRHLAKGQERHPWTAQAARLSAGRFVSANAKHGTRIVCDRIASAICGNWQGDNLDKLHENEYQNGNTRPTNSKNLGSMAEKPRPGQVTPGGLNSTASNFTGGLFDARGRHSGADEG